MLMAMMAVFDGEESEFSPERLNSHLAKCPNCRHEIEQMQNAFNLLENRQRREQRADLWSAIEKRIETKPASPVRAKPFVVLGLFLVIYKLLEMLPEKDFGPAFKIVPLVLVVGLFVFLKENPFKINVELTLER